MLLLSHSPSLKGHEEQQEMPEESQCHFRKGKEEDPVNYRLVSLTFIPGKMMEELTLHCYL